MKTFRIKLLFELLKIVGVVLVMFLWLIILIPLLPVECAKETVWVCNQEKRAGEPVKQICRQEIRCRD